MPISLNQLEFIGHGLVRPECALAHSSGVVFAPDWTDDGGVSVIFPDGSVKRHLARNWSQVAAQTGFDEPLRPNGICLLQGGSILMAHLGAERGGVFELKPDGSVSPLLLDIDGVALPPSNFVTVDASDRIWITVSTRQTPRALAYRHDVADGFVVLMENGKPRIVADDLGYTNECMVHPDGRRLYVNETFARRLTVFDIGKNGDLGNRQTLATFDAGTFPDGLAFDCDGNAWITSIVSNRVLKVTSEGTVETILEDADTAHLAWVEEAWRNHAMGRPHLDKAAGKILRNVSNLAFCGENLERAVLGCLLGDRLAVFDTLSKGAIPVHWTFDIGPLITELEKSSPV